MKTSGLLFILCACVFFFNSDVAHAGDISLEDWSNAVSGSWDGNNCEIANYAELESDSTLIILSGQTLWNFSQLGNLGTMDNNGQINKGWCCDIGPYNGTIINNETINNNGGIGNGGRLINGRLYDNIVTINNVSNIGTGVIDNSAPSTTMAVSTTQATSTTTAPSIIMKSSATLAATLSTTTVSSTTMV
jgi:hypothetical protein